MPTSMNPKKIVLKGSQILGATQKEGQAGNGNIKPGMLLAHAGGSLVPHSVAGGNTAKMVADTPDYIGGGIDYTYAEGDRVKYQTGFPGCEFYMFLDAGESVSEGDLLESAGNGSLQAHTPPEVDAGEEEVSSINVNSIVGQAAETVDNTDGEEPVRIKVEVL